MAKNTLAHAWVQQVERCTDDDLADDVRRGVLGCGAAAGYLLEELLVAPASWDSRVAEHAIVLLGQLRHLPALQFLSDLLWSDPEYEDEVCDALEVFGDTAIPPLVAHLKLRRDSVRYMLVELAAGQGRADVREAFEQVLREEPEAVLDVLVGLDDPAIVPCMVQTLEQINAQDPGRYLTIMRLNEGIEDLGGEVSEEAAGKVAAAQALRLMAEHTAGRRRRGRRRSR